MFNYKMITAVTIATAVLFSAPVLAQGADPEDGGFQFTVPNLTNGSKTQGIRRTVQIINMIPRGR